MWKLGSIEYWKSVTDTYNKDPRARRMKESTTMICKWGDLSPVFIDLKEGEVSVREAGTNEQSEFRIYATYDALVRIYKHFTNEVGAALEGSLFFLGPMERAGKLEPFFVIWGDSLRKTVAEISPQDLEGTVSAKRFWG